MIWDYFYAIIQTNGKTLLSFVSLARKRKPSPNTGAIDNPLLSRGRFCHEKADRHTWVHIPCPGIAGACKGRRPSADATTERRQEESGGETVGIR
jgi:hypothetical protein